MIDVWFCIALFLRCAEAEESGSNAEAAPVFPSRVIRQFRQKKSINNETSQRKHGLSTDVLASLSTFFHLILLENTICIYIVFMVLYIFYPHSAIWRFLKRLRRSMWKPSHTWYTSTILFKEYNKTNLQHFRILSLNNLVLLTLLIDQTKSTKQKKKTALTYTYRQEHMSYNVYHMYKKNTTAYWFLWITRNCNNLQSDHSHTMWTIQKTSSHWDD